MTPRQNRAVCPFPLPGPATSNHWPAPQRPGCKLSRTLPVPSPEASFHHPSGALHSRLPITIIPRGVTPGRTRRTRRTRSSNRDAHLTLDNPAMR
ncbi:hypothetical protein Purlil1_1416 [Purpureocillium lilacinum]|uniref:Uncharacterized protein n=1 Tax=Purpureocillium lilacinum TaxID=33203 RepID=A0ABR0CCD8_PURLI|nr:hypothetical protein Purlil1_1416 [Purpureocillium lilacinum]